MGFSTKIERDQELEAGKSYMLVANHTSMIDIMLMLAIDKTHLFLLEKRVG